MVLGKTRCNVAGTCGRGEPFSSAFSLSASFLSAIVCLFTSVFCQFPFSFATSQELIFTPIGFLYHLLLLLHFRYYHTLSPSVSLQLGFYNLFIPTRSWLYPYRCKLEMSDFKLSNSLVNFQSNSGSNSLSKIHFSIAFT